jgi:classical protein kinase C
MAKEGAGGLKRAQPVRKLFYKRGHKFEAKQFYQVMKCATCAEYLLSGAGYQCVQCKYTCHKRCHEKVVAKCITKSTSERDEDENGAAAAIMKHNIPHRFEKTTLLSGVWCSHCGYLLPFITKPVMRCSECPVTCHEGCMPLIPNLCGMSTEVAFSMMEAIEQAERRKQERGREQRTMDYTPGREERLSIDREEGLTPSPEEEFVQQPPKRMSGVPAPVPPGAPAPAPAAPAAARPIAPSLSISEMPMAPQAAPAGPTPARGSSLQSEGAAPQPIVPPALSFVPATMDRKPDQAAAVPLPPAGRVPSDSAVGAVAGSSAGPSEPAAAAVVSPTKERKRSSKPSVGLDDFHFLAVLGKGNFGKVMLAEEKLTGNLYAIKVLKKDFIIKNDEVESVKSEKRVFQTANLARHPFLVGLHSCFQTETRVYFVMEYISGGDLMWHIQQHQFSEKRAKFYACEVLLALEYFHQNNIVYR